MVFSGAQSSGQLGSMEIIRVALIAVLLGDYGQATKINEFVVSIRHAKKKDHNYREDRRDPRTFAFEEANEDYELWSSSSTDSATSFDQMYADGESTTSSDKFEPGSDPTRQPDEWPTEGASSAASDESTVGYGTESLADELVLDGAKEDVVTKFLRIVESQQELGANCTAGTDLNLGEGVVDRYAQVGASIFNLQSLILYTNT